MLEEGILDPAKVTRLALQNAASVAGLAQDPDSVSAQRQARAWTEHAYSQLLQFRALTLREKIEAIDAMAEVAARVSGRRGG